MLPPEQLRLLLTRLAEPTKSLVWLLFISGLRIGELLALRWQENNVPGVQAPKRTGFGMQLLTRILNAQIGATVDLQYRAEGLEATVTLPLPE